jgi:hypothetical protein
VQPLYLRLESLGRTKTFGGIPGEVQPYGFGSLDPDGAVYAVVNPAQSVQEIRMPQLSREQRALGTGRLLFEDAGFRPVLTEDSVKLGPGQMALVGFGKYARAGYDLGIQEDVQIPRSIHPVDASFVPHGKNTIEATVVVPAHGDLRIVMQQRSSEGNIMRSWKGGPPNGMNMGKFFLLRAWQNGKPVPVEINYDKVIWSGLSWAVGEIEHGALTPGQTVTVQCSSEENDPVALDGKVYEVEY